MFVRNTLAVIFLSLPGVTGHAAEHCDAALKSYQQGAYSEAAAAYEKCYELPLSLTDGASQAANLGIILNRLGRYEEARTWLQRAFEAWPSVPGSADNIGGVALWLVETERTLGHFTAVEPILRSALQAHPQAMLATELHSRLAAILRETGRPEESRAELQAVLATPGITADQRIEALLGQAALDRHIVRFSESLTSLNQALQLAYDQAGRGAQSDVLLSLGATWTSMGDLTRAESLLNRSLSLADTPQRTAGVLQYLGAVHAKQQKYSRAEDELTGALADLRRTLPEGHPQIASATGDLAEVCRLQNNLTAARRYADEAHSAMVRSMGPDSVGAGETLGLIARIEAQANHLPDAAEHYSAAIATLRKQGSDRDFRLTEMMNAYASVLASLHRGDEAKRVRTELNALLPGKLK